jgi:hypothetical protein
MPTPFSLLGRQEREEYNRAVCKLVQFPGFFGIAVAIGLIPHSLADSVAVPLAASGIERATKAVPESQF